MRVEHSPFGGEDLQFAVMADTWTRHLQAPGYGNLLVAHKTMQHKYPPADTMTAYTCVHNAHAHIYPHTHLCTQIHMNTSTHAHTQAYTPLHKQIPMHTETPHNMHMLFVFSISSAPVCFFNPSVYISESKPVSIGPNRAISMEGKANKTSDESKTGFWPHFDSVPAASEHTVISKAVNSTVPGWPLCWTDLQWLFVLQNISLFYICPRHASIHGDLLFEHCFANLLYVSKDGNWNHRLFGA